MDDFAGALVLVHDVRKDFAHLVEVNIVMREEALGRLGVAEDGGERLIQFMGERAGEFAEHRHAGKVGQFRPLLDCFGLGLFAGGDVACNG